MTQYRILNLHSITVLVGRLELFLPFYNSHLRHYDYQKLQMKIHPHRLLEDLLEVKLCLLYKCIDLLYSTLKFSEDKDVSDIFTSISPSLAKDLELSAKTN